MNLRTFCQPLTDTHIKWNAACVSVLHRELQYELPEEFRFDGVAELNQIEDQRLEPLNEQA